MLYTLGHNSRDLDTAETSHTAQFTELRLSLAGRTAINQGTEITGKNRPVSPPGACDKEPAKTPCIGKCLSLFTERRFRVHYEKKNLVLLFRGCAGARPPRLGPLPGGLGGPVRSREPPCASLIAAARAGREVQKGWACRAGRFL